LPEKSADIKRILKLVIGTLVIAGLVFFIVRIVVRDWGEVRRYEWSLDLPMLFGSIAVGCIATFLNSKVTQNIFKAFGGNIPFSRFAFLMQFANFGRYIPGKVAQIAGLLVFMKREGVPRVSTLGAMAVFQVLLIITAGVLGILLAGQEAFSRFTLNIPSWVFALIGLLGIIATIPPILKALANKALTLMKRDPIGYEISFKDWAVAFLSLALGWILYGLSFAMMTASITELELSSFPFVGGAFILAFTIGWMVFISPGGLGVREGVLLLILTAVFPSGVAGLVATAGRIWILTVEAASLGIAAIVFKTIGCKAVSSFSSSCSSEK